jgi:hypothetical protein
MVPDADIKIIDDAVLGAGTTGVVFKAEICGGQSFVAVKVMVEDAPTSSRGQILEDMRQEMAVATKLPW